MKRTMLALLLGTLWLPGPAAAQRDASSARCRRHMCVPGGTMTMNCFTSRLFLIAAWTVLSFLQAGCSLLFVEGPPEGHQQMTSFQCTERNTAPVLDVIWGAYNVLGAVVIAAADTEDLYYSTSGILAYGSAWGLVSALSATKGFRTTENCRKARSRHAEQSAATQRLQPGPIYQENRLRQKSPYSIGDT